MTAAHPAELHRRGQPLTGLYPGWEMGQRISGPAGMDILILQHPRTKEEAYWWLSPDGEILACHALALRGTWQEALVKTLDPVLQPLSASLLDGAAPLPSEDDLLNEPLPLLRALPAPARLQLVTLWFQTARAAMHVISLTVLLEHENESPFSPAFIQKLFRTRLAGPHSLACSPFNGDIIRTELTITLEQGIACRFTDPQEELTFYLFWPHGDEGNTSPETIPPIFYLPKASLLVGEGLFTPLVPTFLLSWFIGTPHCVEELKQARPFTLEDYGVGHASALWDNLSSPKKTTERGKAGQILSSFPFSSLLWGQAAFLRPLGKTPFTPLEDEIHNKPTQKRAQKPYQPRKKKRKKGRKRRS